MSRLENETHRPLMLLGYVDSAHAALCGRHFRRLGWEVHLVSSAAEAYRFLLTNSPRAIVLDTELPDETGWLACAKLRLEDTNSRLFLLAPQRTPQGMNQIGQIRVAGLASRQDTLEDFSELVMGKRLAEAV